MKDFEQYYDLRELVADCGGIEKFRFFGMLDEYTMITPFGFALTSPSDNWVECKINDDVGYDLYTLAHGYKVRVEPVCDRRYAGRLFYQSDLLDLLKQGVFILKINVNDHIEERECLEYLCGNVYVHHHWYEVVQSDTTEAIT